MEHGGGGGTMMFWITIVRLLPQAGRIRADAASRNRRRIVPREGKIRTGI